MAESRLFLGVENSATGRVWRDRLDERAAARALGIAQHHALPELLARILAGRDIETDAVDAFLDPTIKRSMPDPYVLTAMKEAAERNVDLIVVGANRLVSAKVSAHVPGSVSYEVIRRANCPVLTVSA